MPIKQLSSFTNSKVASHKVLNASKKGGLELGKFGKNTHKKHVGLSSKSKASINPTSGNR